MRGFEEVWLGLAESVAIWVNLEVLVWRFPKFGN